MDAVQKLHAFHEFLQVSSHNVPFYQQADELLAVQSKKNYLKMKFGLLGPKLCKAICVKNEGISICSNCLLCT